MRNAEAIAARAASLSSRIKDTARNRGLDAQHLMRRYALERFLSRLSGGPSAGLLTLKGGMVMPLVTGDFARPTEDIDVSAHVEMDVPGITAVISAICVADPEEEDGLIFDPATISVTPIREGLLPGARVVLSGMMATRPRPTPVRVKVDLCFGDTMLPGPVMRILPLSLPGFQPVTMPCYHWSTVVSEKIHAIFRHGNDNTRMKDFADLVALSRMVDHSGADLVSALRGTFAAWGGELRVDPPGMSDAFAVSAQRLWTAFVRSPAGKTAPSPDFRAVVAEVREFADPVIQSAALDGELAADWVAGRGWSAAPCPTPGPTR